MYFNHIQAYEGLSPKLRTQEEELMGLADVYRRKVCPNVTPWVIPYVPSGVIYIRAARCPDLTPTPKRT